MNKKKMTFIFEKGKRCNLGNNIAVIGLGKE